MELWGLPLVSASSVHGPGARTTVPGTEVPRGGLRLGGGGGERGGDRERREGEKGRERRKKPGRGVERATRQSSECACADLARCPGRGVRGATRFGALASGPSGGSWGPAGPSLGLECPFPDWALLPGARELKRRGLGRGRRLSRLALQTRCLALGFPGPVWGSKIRRCGPRPDLLGEPDCDSPCLGWRRVGGRQTVGKMRGEAEL